MKILRSYIRIPPAIGGMENHIKTLTELQRSLGLEVDIAFNDGEKTHKNDIQVLGSMKLYPNIKAPYAILIFYLYLIFRLLIKKNKYDCIHLHGDWSSFIFAPIIKKVTKADKVFFSFHGSIHSNFVHAKILPIIIRKFCNKIFVTGYESYLELSGTEKAIFQPSGIKKLFLTRTNKFKNEKIKIITVTFLRPQKNVITFLKVAKLMPCCKFQIIGDGPDYERLIEYAQNQNIINLKFLGNKKAEEIKKLLESADIFLFTSKEEGTPTAVMEAMACGLPIVTTNAGGIESIISQGENGFVISENYEDPRLFINLINILIEDKILMENIRENNLSKAAAYSWDKVAVNISKEMLDV